MSNMFSDHTIKVGPENGQVDARLDFKNGRQSLPDPSLGNDGETNFGLTGEKELLGEGVGDETITDPDRPSPPTAAKTPEGNFDISLDAVAPVKYPWPKDTGHTGLKNAGPP